jgi:hypothetical protein
MRFPVTISCFGLLVEYKVDEPINKRIAVRENIHRLSIPVSKEYDAVEYIHNRFVEYHIATMTWKAFQQRFQHFAAKYRKLFMEIRHNRPHVRKKDLKSWLDGEHGANNYEVDYSEYEDAENSFRDVKQMVLQINRGADASAILAEDPFLEQYVSYVGQSSGYSGHPAGMETVGWLRVDFVNQEWVLVDEVQSDLVNSVTQAKSIVSATSFGDFVANITNKKVKQLVLEKIDERQFNAGKRQFEQKGYTLEKLDEIKEKLVQLFQDWAEYGIASLLEIARREGIQNVAIHTAETISRRDQCVEAAKIKMYYDNLARAFGFKRQRLNVGELRGNFWVRTAG